MQLMSSIQPISTTRWPRKGSRPVVSVSSTISRMVLPRAFGLREGSQNRSHLLARRREAAGRVDHEIGAFALFRIRHLLRDNGAKFLFRHARACEHAFLLHRLRR